MARTFASPRHDALRAFLRERRKAARLKQSDLAELLKRGQDYVSDIETGQKVVSVIELMELAEALGFDAQEAIKRLYRIPKTTPRR
jgi:transcriptional regulator with XRE-family HTH domain